MCTYSLHLHIGLSCGMPPVALNKWQRVDCTLLKLFMECDWNIPEVCLDEAFLAVLNVVADGEDAD